jgi:XTP/dITP diphosphohydrolase
MAFIVVATANKHKVDEYRELLKDQRVELKSLLDYPGFPGVEEDGATFRENAAKKALAACRYCDVPAFADDSGLEVEALGGAPGVQSARYADTDAARMAKLLANLGDNPNRRARFVCAIAIAINGEVIETFEGEVRGVIAAAPRGAGGFGYDPLFIPDGFDQTFGELPAEVKNRISHRANAFAKAMEFVEDEMSILDDEF